MFFSKLFKKATEDFEYKNTPTNFLNIPDVMKAKAMSQLNKDWDGVFQTIENVSAEVPSNLVQNSVIGTMLDDWKLRKDQRSKLSEKEAMEGDIKFYNAILSISDQDLLPESTAYSDFEKNYYLKIRTVLKTIVTFLDNN